MAVTKDIKTAKSPQEIMNLGFDTEFNLPVVESLEFDGANMVRQTSGSGAVKVTTSGSITYIAVAPAGSSQASAVWQVKKIDETTGVVITWADGNTNFDNVASDLTTLSYS